MKAPEPSAHCLAPSHCGANSAITGSLSFSQLVRLSIPSLSVQISITNTLEKSSHLFVNTYHLIGTGLSALQEFSFSNILLIATL